MPSNETEREASNQLSRRGFIKTTALAGAGLSSALMRSGNFAHAASRDTIRVGLVGCGGRGSGAAGNAVAAAPGVELYAMADLFADRLDAAREALQEHLGDAFNVTDDRCFVGFDAYRHVIDSDVDYVILATPPGFRPQHLRAAVEAGKHVFMEKPVAVDSAGVRSVLASGKLAKEKGLSLVPGTQFRRQPSYVEAVRRIHDGMIGDIVAAQSYRNSGPVWLREREPGMSDMEWQCRNWYYFTWLSGDFLVEQAIHNIDTLHWVFQGPPVKANGLGGRQTRVDPSYGHIFDHFAIEYIYPGDVRVLMTHHQMEGVPRRVANRFVGLKGVAFVNPDSSIITSHSGETLFEYPERGNNPYVQEHTDLIESIRNGTPINEAKDVAESTLVSILGREAAYTGQELTWEEVMEADLDLVPDELAFGPAPFPPVAEPGKTPLNRTI